MLKCKDGSAVNRFEVQATVLGAVGFGFELKPRKITTTTAQVHTRAHTKAVASNIERSVAPDTYIELAAAEPLNLALGKAPIAHGVPLQTIETTRW